MIQRKRILQQSGIFLKQNPGEAHLTIDELCEMAGSSNSAAFMSKVSRYVSNIAGTNAYWYKVREELKAIIMLLVNNMLLRLLKLQNHPHLKKYVEVYLPVIKPTVK
jgi:hypothetical protein